VADGMDTDEQAGAPTETFLSGTNTICNRPLEIALKPHDLQRLVRSYLVNSYRSSRETNTA
jgi:hypothetical protein